MEPESREWLFEVIERRFLSNIKRHIGIHWTDIERRLEKRPAKLLSLKAMEETGGEPDLIGSDPKTGEFLFVDCSLQSPSGRRSLCFDAEALEARKENKPKGSAAEMARSMGIELLTEQEYRAFQQLGEFDTTTSSWVQTPIEIRKKGGALFCDRRYDHVFLYHNGAQSYYAARGFRGLLRV